MPYPILLLYSYYNRNITMSAALLESKFLFLTATVMDNELFFIF